MELEADGDDGGTAATPLSCGVASYCLEYQACICSLDVWARIRAALRALDRIKS